MKNRIHGKAIALPVCLIVISAIMIVVFGFIEYIIDKPENHISAEEPFSYSSSPEEDGLLFYRNAWYVPKDSLESVLILGIDKKMTDSSEELRNSEQADFLALLVMDDARKSYTIVQLNRDTMTEIPRIGVTGQETGSIYAQLALAHTYGGDERTRCRNTVRTVENLLYGIEIDHYLSLTMDAIPILNDLAGGVEVRLTDDFSDLDESFVRDAVVTLRGEQALAYVQARSSLDDTTNLHRMERQRQYLSALLGKIGEMEPEEMTEAVPEISEYMVSDCTIHQLADLAEKLGSYTCERILTPAGEAVRGEEFMEYYMDESEAQALAAELFFEPETEIGE